MKNLIVLFSSMVFIVVFSAHTNAKPSMHSSTSKDSIQVWTSPDLFEIATTWAIAYESINPEMKINISTIPEDRAISMIEMPDNIGLINKNLIPEAKSKSIWKITVGRDIIVPVMNSKNPFLEEISKSGISPEKFAEVLTNKENPTWGTLLNNEVSSPAKFYCIGNDQYKLYLSEFLQTDINKINRTNILETDEILNAIIKDKYALGFCRLVDVLSSDNQGIKDGISFIPIDLNGNNKIDFIENIYNNSNALERGVWIGKYPKVLYSNIYAVAGKKPIKNNELAFLKWIVTDGQQYLYNKGYSELIFSERHDKVQALNTNQLSTNVDQKSAQGNRIFLLTVFVILAALIAFMAFTLITYKDSDAKDKNLGIPTFFSESTVSAPQGLFFDKTHTWAFMEKDGLVRIGIADFLQHVTGSITNVKMKNSGELVNKGEPFITIVQHGKQLNINSPVSGKIKEINDQLKSNSSLINSSPYSEGWVYSIESFNWLKEIKTFFMGDTYKVWLNGEFSRLKHFFTSCIKLNVSEQLQQVIQDGGELNDGLLEGFGPVIWEEFQSRFINRGK